MNTIHYATYDFVQLSCDGVPVIFRNRRYQISTNTPGEFIYMPTEMMHGLYDGGAGAGFADVWNLMSQSKFLGGGFIWAFLDEGVRRADGKIDVASNEAPDGIRSE